MTCPIDLRVIYPYSVRFCGHLDLLEGKFWGGHPFLWLFSWFKKWHFRQFWHIPSTYWRTFSEWVSKSFKEYFNLLLPIFAVNLNYWRANFEITILFFDFFVGSKSDISGSFGTFLADIGGIFVNELTKHFQSNLLFSFVILQSTWLTREEFLYSLSFSFTFFSVPKLTLLAVLAHF